MTIVELLAPFHKPQTEVLPCAGLSSIEFSREMNISKNSSFALKQNRPISPQSVCVTCFQGKAGHNSVPILFDMAFISEVKVHVPERVQNKTSFHADRITSEVFVFLKLMKHCDDKYSASMTRQPGTPCGVIIATIKC